MPHDYRRGPRVLPTADHLHSRHQPPASQIRAQPGKTIRTTPNCTKRWLDLDKNEAHQETTPPLSRRASGEERRRPAAGKKPGATMAAAAAGSGGGGVVKHLVIVQFKEDVTPERLDELISGYAGLVDKVPSMKAFHWGTDVSIENMHQGFTHVFESTFESTEGVKEYVYHPAHVEFANDFLASTAKVLIIDFKPAAGN